MVAQTSMPATSKVVHVPRLFMRERRTLNSRIDLRSSRLCRQIACSQSCWNGNLRCRRQIRWEFFVLRVLIPRAIQGAAKCSSICCVTSVEQHVASRVLVNIQVPQWSRLLPRRCRSYRCRTTQRHDRGLVHVPTHFPATRIRTHRNLST